MWSDELEFSLFKITTVFCFDMHVMDCFLSCCVFILRVHEGALVDVLFAAWDIKLSTSFDSTILISTCVVAKKFLSVRCIVV